MTDRELEALRRRVEEIETEIEQLRALDKSRTEILSTVSHELRTPLVTIIGYVEMLGQQSLGELSEQAQGALSVVLRNALKLSSLIDDLLNLGRLQAGELKPFAERFAITPLARKVLEDYHLLVEERELQVNDALPDDLPEVRADRRLVRIALENLVKNAVKFGRRGGEVHVAGRVIERRVEITVGDTGVGIPEEALSRVFEPFYQADGSPTRAYGGIGAGLAIVQRIVEAHDGKVLIESHVGEGTRVTIDLPLATESA